MGWGNKFPDLKNDPSYLEPRLTAVEATANSNTSSLAENTSFMKKLWVDVTDLQFGATGGLNDSSAFQAANDYLTAHGGGILYVPPGTWYANFTIDGNITLQGAGVNATTIKSVSGSNLDVIKGRNFDDLSSLALNASLNSSTQFGCSFLNIRDICIDGNKANNTNGSGIKVFGCSFHWENVYVSNCAGDGILTQFGLGFSTTNQILLFLESLFSHVKSINNNGNGWVHNGPHDSIFNSVHLAKNGGWGFKNYANHKSMYMNCYTNTLGAIYSESTFEASMLQVNSDYGLTYTDFQNGVTQDYGVYSKSEGCTIYSARIDGFANGIYATEISGDLYLHDVTISRGVLGFILNNSNQAIAKINFLNVKYGVNLTSNNNNNMYTLNGSFNETSSFIHYPGSAFRSADVVQFNGITSINSFYQTNAQKVIPNFNWTAPTTGSYNQGDIVYNYNASPGGYIGWVCTTQGTFGTLNSGATTGSITSGTETLTVNSLAGLAIGNKLSIAGLTGVYTVMGIDTVNKIVTLDTNANATVSNAVISFSTPVMKGFGTIQA